MGNRKKNQEPQTSEASIVNLDARHQELKNKVTALEAIAHTFADIDEQIKQPLIEELNQRIRDNIYALKTIPKSELEREQGKITGYEEVLSMIDGSDWADQLHAAHGELENYEHQNALTLEPETKDGE